MRCSEHLQCVSLAATVCASNCVHQSTLYADAACSNFHTAHDWLVQSDRCGTTQSAQSTFGSHRIQPLYLQALRSPTHCSSWLFPCNAQDVCIAVGCGIGGSDHSRHHYWCTPAGAPRQCRSAPAKACCICQQFLLTAAVDIYQKGIPKR